MTENEVNEKVERWILANNYKYKGILNKGKGQVAIPLPNGGRDVLIDHQGVRDKPVDIIWIEAKGEGDNLSQLLEGFIRLVAACYYGGGKGLLAIPDAEYRKLIGHKHFLAQIGRAAERQIGLLNVESNKQEWFT